MDRDGRRLPGPAERRNGGGGGGSVRRARERMNAGLNFDASGAPDAPAPTQRAMRPNDAPRYPPQARRQGPMPAPLNSRNNQGPVGAAISRPTPVAQNAQWPLQDDTSAPRALDSSRSPPRGPPPQRPPRPSHVPSILDSSRLQEYAPSYPNRPQQQQQRQPQPPPPQQQQQNDSPQRPGRSNQILSPFSDGSDSTPSPNTLSAPRTPNSGDRSSYDRPSTASSTGTIPDFPVPQMPVAAPSPAPAQRRLMPGPPPIMRRGVSSYYSQTSFVSPIPEEMPEAMRAGGSIASSRAIPSSWGSRPDGFDIDVYADNLEDDYEPEGRAGSSSSQHDDTAGLVRQASLGKKAKPTLRTINSSDDTPQARKMDFSKPGIIGRAAVAAGAAGGAVAAGLGNRDDGSSARSGNRTVLLDSSSSDSRNSSRENLQLPGAAPSTSPLPRSRSPLASPIDPDGARFGDNTNSSGYTEKLPPQRRPPRLDIDAVREAEARGSLTSLPDLIRRATRLAGNLDRGKTASRLGLWDIMNAESDAGGEKNGHDHAEQRRSGSISDILASFPPPALGTPTGERPTSRWPSPFTGSGLQQEYFNQDPAINEKPAKKKGRRCCGMPLWAFLVVLLVLFCLIAAAVIIPVALIVLPKTENMSSTAAADTTSSCSQSTPCDNGGVSVLTNNQCRCVCVNGFTGSSCSTASDASCTTMEETVVTEGQKNVTIGNAIPRLLTSASTTFDIPLGNQDLLSLFSSSNLSCTTENALVTFDGKSSKRFYILPDGPEEIQSYVANEASTIIEKRHIVDEFMVVRRDDAVATTNGIVYEATSTAAAAATTAATTSSSAAASSTSASSSADTTSSGLNLTQDVIDFARIVVLFIFDQTNELTSAVMAQEKIQTFFTGDSSTNMTMGMSSTNFTLNFSAFSITLQNGTVVGGKGNGSGGLSP